MARKPLPEQPGHLTRLGSLHGGKKPSTRRNGIAAMLELQSREVKELAPPTTNGTIPTLGHRPSRAELIARGESLRRKCPRNSHAVWKPPMDRPDPVELVKEGNKGRIPELVPIRHGRMIQSPFTYYRGAALAMAVDLGNLPVTGARVQACGDAHLGNFRIFATPERRVIFDIHDLDETLPAPWEWDVKRLTTSFVIAARNNGLSEKRANDAVLTCVRSYREHMAEFSEMRALEVWYHSLDADKLVEAVEDTELRGRAKKRLAKAKAQHTLEYDFPKLADATSESPSIRDNPPLIYHWHERGSEDFDAAVQEAFVKYRATLSDDRRVLLDHYELRDITIKVVGVGSVGTFCAVMLLMAGEHDPLFLQVKQASESVLEPYAGKSVYSNHGERVVRGHRLMQSASDVFLGWTEGRFGRQFYIRQLRDAKIKFAIETFDSAELNLFAQWCGWTLARAHARSGEPAVITGYLGEGDVFDEAIAAFAVAYADQSEQDHTTLTKAVRAGKLEAVIEREE
jgi:uncharacterized protein (DUF2252 family)